MRKYIDIAEALNLFRQEKTVCIEYTTYIRLETGHYHPYTYTDFIRPLTGNSFLSEMLASACMIYSYIFDTANTVYKRFFVMVDDSTGQIDDVQELPFH